MHKTWLGFFFLICAFHLPQSSALGLAASFSGETNNTESPLIFFDGTQYQRWRPTATHMEPGFPKRIAQAWPEAPAYLDALAYSGEENPAHPHKVLFFKNGRYWRWDVASATMDPGYPKRIVDDWPGLPSRIDAAVYAPYHQSARKDKLYFFSSNQYWRWDIESNQLDADYPKNIDQGWAGMPNSSIDMATFSGFNLADGGNKIYLFQGNQYWRWDITTDLLDMGYPKQVHNAWPGLRY